MSYQTYRHSESFRAAVLRQMDHKQITLFTGGNTFSGELDCSELGEGVVIVYRDRKTENGTVVFVDCITAIRDGI